MKSLPLLCILACSLAEGNILPKPNVVFQSVVLGKKPEDEVANGDDECQEYSTLNDLNEIISKIFHGLCPHSTRYKRDESSYSGIEGFDDKTIDRLLDALDELKQDAEKNPEDAKEREENASKTRLDQIRREGKWQRKMEECLAKRRKSDLESYKKLKDNVEDFLAENKDLQQKFKKLTSRKKDWKEELERRRLKESLAESWPRVPEERLPEDLYFPMSYHHHPSHQRSYPTGGYLP